VFLQVCANSPGIVADDSKTVGQAHFCNLYALARVRLLGVACKHVCNTAAFCGHSCRCMEFSNRLFRLAQGLRHQLLDRWFRFLSPLAHISVSGAGPQCGLFKFVTIDVHEYYHSPTRWRKSKITAAFPVPRKTKGGNRGLESSNRPDRRPQ